MIRAKKILVNVDCIKEQLDAGTINAFSFFIKAKLLFGNSTIYKANTSTRKLAELFGCSHTVVKKYLTELKQQGLIRYTNGNITFVSLSKTEHQLSKLNQTKIWVCSTDTLSVLVCRLKFALLNKNAEHQNFIKQLKADINNAKKRLDKDRLKEKRKYIDSLPSEKLRQLNGDLNISNYKLAKMLNCSIQQVSYLKKKWAELNLVRFQKVWKPLGKVNPKFFSLYRNSNKYAYVNKYGYGFELQHSRFTLLGV